MRSTLLLVAIALGVALYEVRELRFPAAVAAFVVGAGVVALELLELEHRANRLAPRRRPCRRCGRPTRADLCACCSTVELADGSNTP